MSVYLYIFLNKNWKIYWSKQRLLVLGRKTGAHYEDCNRKCHWIKDQGYFSCHMVCKSLPSDTNMANGYPCTKRSIFRIKPCYAATIGSDKFLSWKNLAVGLRAFNIFLVFKYNWISCITLSTLITWVPFSQIYLNVEDMYKIPLKNLHRPFNKGRYQVLLPA
jgi:hypothetical protein